MRGGITSARLEYRRMNEMRAPRSGQDYTTTARYSTAHYTGYPTAQDDYAYDEPFGYSADTLLILTRLHPTH